MNTEKKLKPYDSTEPTAIFKKSVILEQINDIQSKRFVMCFILNFYLFLCVLKMAQNVPGLAAVAINCSLTITKIPKRMGDKYEFKNVMYSRRHTQKTKPSHFIKPLSCAVFLF